MELLSSVWNSVQGNPKLDEATTDDDRPTPFNLYMELAKQTFDGGPVCERMASQLFGKLSNGSPAVKIKCLLVIIHLLEKGHISFQRQMQQGADKIRPCLEFRCPADPVLGDAPARIVRERAQTVFNMMYDTRPGGDQRKDFAPPPSITGPKPGGPPATTTGISNLNKTAIQGPYMAPKEQSLAERMYDAVRPADETTAAITQFFETAVSQIQEKIYTKEPGAYDPHAGSNYRAPDENGVITPATHHSSSLNNNKPTSSAPVSGGHYPTVDGRASHQQKGLNTVEPDAPTPGVPGGGWGPLSPAAKPQPGAAGGPEKSWVQTICQPSGVKLPPTRAQLTTFISKVKDSINAEYICYLLAEELASSDWKRRLRSLYAIHELLITKIPPTFEYFSTDGLDSLLHLVPSPQKTVKDQTIKIIQLVSPQSLQVVEPPPEPEDEPEEPAVAPGPAISNSIFAGLVPSAEPTPVPVAKAPSIFDDVPVVGSPQETLIGKPNINLLDSPSAIPPPQLSGVTFESLAPQSPAQPSEPFDLLSPEPSAVRRPRQPSESKIQLETVFNETQAKQNILNELDRMQTWPAQPGYGYPPQQPFQNFGFAGTTGVPAAAAPAPTPAFPNFFGAPGAAATPAQYPPQAFTFSGGASGNTEPARKKDMFDFGDLRSIDQSM